MVYKWVTTKVLWAVAFERTTEECTSDPSANTTCKDKFQKPQTIHYTIESHMLCSVLVKYRYKFHWLYSKSNFHSTYRVCFFWLIIQLNEGNWSEQRLTWPKWTKLMVIVWYRGKAVCKPKLKSCSVNIKNCSPLLLLWCWHLQGDVSPIQITLKQLK